MKMTQHAARRSQQRCIPPMMVELLQRFGTSQPAGDGTSRLYFDKAARRHVESFVGHMAGLFSEHMDLYAIVSADYEVITVAHLTKRVQRN